MAKEKFDFEAYVKWCEENHLVAEESANLDKYKAEVAKVAEKGEKERKIAEQKEVFDTIAKYLGRKVVYNPNCFEGVEQALESIIDAMDMVNMMNDIGKAIEKAIDKHGK